VGLELRGKRQFTVKSAYRLKRQIDDVAEGGQMGSQAACNNFDWNSIWKLECLTKVKLFVWRISHNSLPHRLNLLQRGMDLGPIFPVCNRVNEDGAHLFLKCKTAKLGWREL
jgi:hypothetical protein